MRLLIFADIHGDLRALERLVDLEADHYFAAGDLVSWARGFERVGEILRRHAGKVHVLPGNHESEADITAFCKRYGFDAFHGRTVALGDYHIGGLGYSSPTPFNTPGEYSEDEFARRLKKFAGLKPLILICHCPPKGTPLDRAAAGMHIGSQAIREFMEAHEPEYLFCGHVHETEGMEVTFGRTRCINPGKQGFLLDFDKIGVRA